MTNSVMIWNNFNTVDQIVKHSTKHLSHSAKGREINSALGR